MENWKKLCEKIGKDRIWICIIGGLILLVVTYPIPDKKQENYTIMGEKKEKAENMQVFVDENQGDHNAYARAEEQKLSAILSRIEGAGKVEVFLSFSDYGSKVVEKDVSYSRNNEEQMGMNQEELYTVTSENTETTIYTVGEDGNEIPFVQKVTLPKVEGVLVVTQGGDNEGIIREMKEAIMALFGIEEHKIKIAKMKGEER
ncbi:MAG: hypothetical protein J6K37_01795 [Lachnospiraceae bacterium]|nr:hypothetical protein [Lachnospiraceae bacterium]